jgi:hypothetical protein
MQWGELELSYEPKSELVMEMGKYLGSRYGVGVELIAVHEPELDEEEFVRVIEERLPNLSGIRYVPCGDGVRGSGNVMEDISQFAQERGIVCDEEEGGSVVLYREERRFRVKVGMDPESVGEVVLEVEDLPVVLPENITHGR